MASGARIGRCETLYLLFFFGERERGREKVERVKGEGKKQKSRSSFFHSPLYLDASVAASVTNIRAKVSKNSTIKPPACPARPVFDSTLAAGPTEAMHQTKADCFWEGGRERESGKEGKGELVFSFSRRTKKNQN